VSKVYSLYFRDTQVALLLGSCRSPFSSKVEERGKNQTDARDLFFVVPVVYSLRGKMWSLKLSEKSIQAREESSKSKEERLRTTVSLSLSDPGGS